MTDVFEFIPKKTHFVSKIILSFIISLVMVGALLLFVYFKGYSIDQNMFFLTASFIVLFILSFLFQISGDINRGELKEMYESFKVLEKIEFDHAMGSLTCKFTNLGMVFEGLEIKPILYKWQYVTNYKEIKEGVLLEIAGRKDGFKIPLEKNRKIVIDLLNQNISKISVS